MVSEVQNSKLSELSVFLKTWSLLFILVSHEHEINIKADTKKMAKVLIGISLKTFSLLQGLRARDCATKMCADRESWH